MYWSLRIGKTTRIIDPATGRPVAVIVTAVENGKAPIKVVAPSEASVTKVREPEPPTTLH